MNKIFAQSLVLMGLFILPVTRVVAQNPVKKVYAFAREVSPGREKIVMKPGGNPVKLHAVTKTTWLFFIAGNLDTTVTKASFVWINGQQHAVLAQSFITTPYYIKNNNLPKELIPATTHKVLQIVPGQILTTLTNSVAKKLSLKNELVIAIKSGNKNYYITCKKITKLEPQQDL